LEPVAPAGCCTVWLTLVVVDVSMGMVVSFMQ